MSETQTRIVRVGGFFSGIGSHHSAVDRLDIPGIQFVVRWQCETDPRKVEAYNLIHGQTPNLGDITLVNDLDGEREVDLLTWTPPCQSISIARRGKGEGNTKGSGTRSALAFEVPRILRNTVNRPEWLIMEEVPTMVGKNFLPNFEELIGELAALGYTSVWKVVNATDFGVGQARRRLICISHIGGSPPPFPEPSETFKPLRDYLEDEETVPAEYYLHASRLEGLVRSTEMERERGNGFRFYPFLPPYDRPAHTIDTIQSRKTGTFVFSDRHSEDILLGPHESGLLDRLGIPYDHYTARRRDTGEDHD